MIACPTWPKAAHEVVQEAKDAGAWVFPDGLEGRQASVVATDGAVTDGPCPETKEVLGGFSVVDVPSLGRGAEEKRSSGSTPVPVAPLAAEHSC